jgi:drug/metabolite transporter (DMT)-like permease
LPSNSLAQAAQPGFKLTHGRAVLLMVACTLMWSIAGVVSRQIVAAKGVETTFWRSLFTIAALLVLLPLFQGKGALVRLPWKHAVFWISGVCWAVMFTAFMMALSVTSVGNVLITMAVSPLLTALVARVFIGHALPVRTWGAIAVACAGMAYMFGSQLNVGAPGALLGGAIALLVPIAAAVHWTVVQWSQQRAAAGSAPAIDLVPCVLVGAVISVLLTLPLALPFQALPSDIGWLALLGVVQLAIPCSLAVVCARKLEAPEVSLLSLLEVVFGIAWAWVFAREAPEPAVLVGGALVISALVANEWLGWRRAR